MSEEGTDSREAIMEATYEAMIESGYADLTMSDIAEASGTSTSLLHYHFDTKEALLVSFLDHLIRRIEADLAEAANDDPLSRLQHVLSYYLLEDEPERAAFHVALLELRAQGPYNEAYRVRLAEADQLLRTELATILSEGVEQGLLAVDDPEQVAALILAAMDGSRSRQLMVGDPAYSATVSDALYEHVLLALLTDDGREQWNQINDPP